MKKSILIIGGSGGIGGAVARLFQKHGWKVYLLLRSVTKLEVKELISLENVYPYECNPQNKEDVEDTFLLFKEQDIHFDLVFHSAGTFLWDDGFPSKTPMSVEEVKKALTEANFVTKQNIVKALRDFYSQELKNIKQYIVSSHAAKFAPGSPYRTGQFKEESYVEVMTKVSELGENLNKEGNWGEVVVLEPGLINTEMAKEAFTEERIGKVDWSTIQSPEEYADAVFPETFFTAGQ
jgi:NAD(P)-dependent dehydrogenase (short-subunit alcohol dehydrogenase family)